MCSSPWGCKELDTTECMNRGLGSGSPLKTRSREEHPTHKSEKNPHWRSMPKQKDFQSITDLCNKETQIFRNSYFSRTLARLLEEEKLRGLTNLCLSRTLSQFLAHFQILRIKICFCQCQLASVHMKASRARFTNVYLIS